METKRRRLLWWILGSLMVLLCLSLILAAYRFEWVGTGFPSKTLWDWMQLLIIPTVLAVAAFLFNLTTSRNEQKLAQQRDQTAQEIALDSQREALLQTYLDRMSELLLDKHLRESKPKDEVRSIARARTLTLLPQLDARRKGSLLQFLYESNLIKVAPGENVLSLKEADLTNANLVHINLHNISLRESNLSGAQMDDTNLHNADLSWANLSNATLRDTNLGGVNFSRATLVGVVLSGNNLSKADFSNTDLRKTRLCGVVWDEANQSKIYAHGTNIPVVRAMVFTNLKEANFTKALLSGVDLHYTDLAQASLSEADLSNADLSYSDLERACLCKAKLHRASLCGARLRWADLSEADLSEADFSKTKLEDALSLKGTNLFGIKGLTREQLVSCKTKGAIIEASPLASASQSTVAPPPPAQSNDAQASSSPSA